MTGLPPIVQRAPLLLYIAAALFFFAAMAINLRELNTMPTSYDETMRPLVFQAVARSFYQAALEALYIAANGILAQILLAIWRDGANRRASGDEE